MQRFAISRDAKEIDFPEIVPPNGRRAIWRAKKLFAEIIHDVTALEGNPFTLPEIQTLLDGVTVGGRKISDAQQVLNQRDSYLRLFELVESGSFSLNARIALELQRLAAHGEALEEGVFRRGKVTIGGTDYLPPAGEGDSLARSLEEQFARMIDDTGALGNPFEQGMVAFLHVARQRSFWHGNKRTGRHSDEWSALVGRPGHHHGSGNRAIGVQPENAPLL